MHSMDTVDSIRIVIYVHTHTKALGTYGMHIKYRERNHTCWVSQRLCCLLRHYGLDVEHYQQGHVWKGRVTEKSHGPLASTNNTASNKMFLVQWINVCSGLPVCMQLIICMNLSSCSHDCWLQEA